MRWAAHRVVQHCLSSRRRYNSVKSVPIDLQDSRTILIENLARAFRPTQYLLNHVQEGAIEELDYDPHKHRVTLSFLYHHSAISVYNRIKSGDIRLLSNLGQNVPVSCQMVKSPPLKAKLVAGLADQNINRVLVITFGKGKVDDISGTIKKIMLDANKLGPRGKVFFESGDWGDVFIVYFYSIELALKARALWRKDPAYDKATISHSQYDPCDVTMHKHLKQHYLDFYDRVLVSNLPERMGTGGVVSLLQPELGRFRSIRKVQEGAYSITFFTHESASEFLDAGIAKYIGEPGLRKVVLTADGRSGEKSKRVLDAAQLGATRTITVLGIVNLNIFSKTRIQEDFRIFGEPYKVSWNSHTRQMHVTFADVMEACRAIYHFESQMRSKRTISFRDYVSAGLSITFGPEPDSPMPTQLPTLEPLRLRKTELIFT